MIPNRVARHGGLFAFPNGLVWRRLSYESQQPDKLEGYSWQPIDFSTAIPPDVSWEKLVRPDARHGDYHVAAISGRGIARGLRPVLQRARPGRRMSDAAIHGGMENAACNTSLNRPLGFAMVMPCVARCPFIIFGKRSGSTGIRVTGGP